MTFLMRASVGDILAATGGAQAITRYLDTCVAVSKYGGYAPRNATIERYRPMLSAPGSAPTASMLRDRENGGTIEVDQVVAFVL